MHSSPGAVDGLAVRIRGPSRDECENPASYFNRKGFFSVNLQAICDRKRRFRLASIKCCGSTHDSTAWACSEISTIAAKLAKLGLWIAGDDAYPLSEWLITPYPGKGIPDEEDNFNFYQSSIRINIGESSPTMPIMTSPLAAECAFGMLIRRWGILRRSLEVDLGRVVHVVSACMILHNICVDHKPSNMAPASEDAAVLHSYSKEMREVYGVVLQSQVNDESRTWVKEKYERRSNTNSKMRDCLAEQVAQNLPPRPKSSQYTAKR